MQTLTFHGSRDQLRGLLHALPGVLSGRTPDAANLARGLQLRLGTALLSQIQQDFLTLSRGGSSRDGRKWPPLKPQTIARRLAKGQPKRKGGKRKPPASASYAGVVDILRDTGRLFRSLAAGVEDKPAAPPDQVLVLGRGELIVGTNVPYAGAHQVGNPKRNLPARPFLPVGRTIPPAYWPSILIAGTRGLVAAVVLICQRGGR